MTQPPLPIECEPGHFDDVRDRLNAQIEALQAQLDRVTEALRDGVNILKGWHAAYGSDDIQNRFLEIANEALSTQAQEIGE